LNVFTFVFAFRTKAEQQHEEYMLKREAERMSSTAAKSHRERIQEYNEKLSQLTEHHDIPKVGPG
jgi:protein FAM32A